MARINFFRTKGLLPALVYVFFITFIMFPGFIQDTSFKFMHGWKDEDSWFNVMTLLLNNLFDTIGRSAGSWKCMQISRKMILWLSYLRTLMLVIIFLIAFEVGPSWLFCSDWLKILTISSFAFQNGWLSSLCVIKSPNYVEQHERGDIGCLTGPAIVAGILVGTLLAIPLEPVINLTPKGKAS